VTSERGDAIVAMCCGSLHSHDIVILLMVEIAFSGVKVIVSY